jgi:hypothetical protein
MSDKQAEEQVFVIKRFLPSDVLDHMHVTKSGRRIPSKSYDITTDAQRFHFVTKVLSKELTIREVPSLPHL